VPLERKRGVKALSAVCDLGTFHLAFVMTVKSWRPPGGSGRQPALFSAGGHPPRASMSARSLRRSAARLSRTTSARPMNGEAEGPLGAVSGLWRIAAADRPGVSDSGSAGVDLMMLCN
jgi:hypothetical protein